MSRYSVSFNPVAKGIHNRRSVDFRTKLNYGSCYGSPVNDSCKSQNMLNNPISYSSAMKQSNHLFASVSADKDSEHEKLSALRLDGPLTSTREHRASRTILKNKEDRSCYMMASSRHGSHPGRASILTNNYLQSDERIRVRETDIPTQRACYCSRGTILGQQYCTCGLEKSVGYTIDKNSDISRTRNIKKPISVRSPDGNSVRGSISIAPGYVHPRDNCRRPTDLLARSRLKHDNIDMDENHLNAPRGSPISRTSLQNKPWKMSSQLPPGKTMFTNTSYSKTEENISTREFGNRIPSGCRCISGQTLGASCCICPLARTMYDSTSKGEAAQTYQKANKTNTMRGMATRDMDFVSSRDSFGASDLYRNSNLLELYDSSISRSSGYGLSPLRKSIGMNSGTRETTRIRTFDMNSREDHLCSEAVQASGSALSLDNGSFQEAIGICHEGVVNKYLNPLYFTSSPNSNSVLSRSSLSLSSEDDLVSTPSQAISFLSDVCEPPHSLEIPEAGQRRIAKPLLNQPIAEIEEIQESIVQERHGKPLFKQSTTEIEEIQEIEEAQTNDASAAIKPSTPSMVRSASVQNLEEFTDTPSHVTSSMTRNAKNNPQRVKHNCGFFTTCKKFDIVHSIGNTSKRAGPQ
ncbi:hypothetical protein KP509_32G056900 [Ceratopteris richardii]|uniref:Uncharacterized protein n=1 Tax=Ceratopteris richardii TaxID=49495 RepID=A0A8T2QVL1_CERRI|nr:hypothetical protein KP509_32G056900 [Ceratopteris richardii]